jgi:uncharacterized protein YqjF (DUF2071 family)
MHHDFDYAVLNHVGHRPWPIRDSSWVMTQTWHDLLFAHWPVDRQQLASNIPSPLELDVYEGEAWLGIVPFHMTNVAPRGVPALPWVSAFPELNVRTYVTVGGKPGVYFFSLDAGNPVAVTTARTMFGLPYHWAAMRVNVEGGLVRYESARKAANGSVDARLAVTYGPTGSAFQAEARSLEYFLTERYCLYTVDRAGTAHRLDIHHPPWSLQPAVASFQTNSMAEANGLALQPVPPLLHFARRQDMVAWWPARAR